MTFQRGDDKRLSVLTVRASALGILRSTHVAIQRLDYAPKYVVVVSFKPKQNQVSSLLLVCRQNPVYIINKS